jgi:hypothetical protein
MLGSNNEVAVLDAVLGSLSKSPAFASFEAPVSEPVPVISLDFNAFKADMEAYAEELEDEGNVLIGGDLFHDEPVILTEAEAAEMAQMERLLNL